MSYWVALLRGVNVNGITVRSIDLAQLFTDLGFAGVRTVLASGNVCFETETDGHNPDRVTLKSRIEAGLRERFGYDAWIVLVEHHALAEIIDSYPFELDAEHHAYVIFASTAQAQEQLLAVSPGPEKVGDEQTAAGDGVVYWRCPKGESTNTPFSKHVAKASFKATTTTRNINTLRKLL